MCTGECFNIERKSSIAAQEFLEFIYSTGKLLTFEIQKKNQFQDRGHTVTYLAGIWDEVFSS